MIEDLGAAVFSIDVCRMTDTALNPTGILIEIGIAATHRIPIEDTLIAKIVPREGPFQGYGLTRTGGKQPGDAVGMAIFVT